MTKDSCLLSGWPALFMFLLSSCAWQGVNSYPLTSAYPRYRDLAPRMSYLADRYPDLVLHRIIGFTETENLPIYAVELGKGERNILIIGQHHGDEMLGVALAFHLIENWSRQYQKNSQIRELLDEYKFWIIPSLNPEAWRLVGNGTARIKRKNNLDTDGNGKLDIRTDGVDLNRNYPVFWDLDSETDQRSSFYKGSAPASEPEIQAIIALARKVSFELAIFYHSSLTGAINETIFLPAVQQEDEDYLRLQELASFYAQNVKRDYLGGKYTLHTGNTSKVGNARNFFFHSLGVPAMLIEIGGVNKAGKSIIHPPDRMVKSLNRRHEQALLKTIRKFLAD